MKHTISRCSMQHLCSILSPLEQYKDYVIWIRSHDMLQQIYVSQTFEAIWGRDATSTFEVPLLWFDYLHPENKMDYMKQLSNRHHQNYQNPEKNLAFYQIMKPDGTINYIRCQCFKMNALDNQQYIIGIAKNMDPTLWHLHYSHYILVEESLDEIVKKELFFLLKQAFGITTYKKMRGKNLNWQALREHFNETQQVIFSGRELESLYHLCQGKTAKVTAQDMKLSPRTVETYLESIRDKSGCRNKLEVISRFSRYFGSVENFQKVEDELF